MRSKVGIGDKMTDHILDEIPFWYEDDIEVEPMETPDASKILLPLEDTEYNEEDLMLKWLPKEEKKDDTDEMQFDKEMFNYE